MEWWLLARLLRRANDLTLRSAPRDTALKHNRTRNCIALFIFQCNIMRTAQFFIVGIDYLCEKLLVCVPSNTVCHTELSKYPSELQINYCFQMISCLFMSVCYTCRTFHVFHISKNNYNCPIKSSRPNTYYSCSYREVGQNNGNTTDTAHVCLLIWCWTTFCLQYSRNLSWNGLVPVFNSLQRSFIPLLLTNIFKLL
jgi:hypothetical protein